MLPARTAEQRLPFGALNQIFRKLNVMRVSVCMATYNGQPYIEDQMASILDQLGRDDEVVVVDDCSNDLTLDIIAGMNDPRIKIFRNERNLGHVQSFSRVLGLGSGDLLIMADQDDIWLPERVSKMNAALAAPSTSCLASNSEFMHSSGARMQYDCEGVTSDSSTDFAGNIWSIFTGRRRYYGCAMAVKKDFCGVILPIPKYVESHDLWIAMAGNMARANVHIDAATLVRRVHGNNASIVQRPLVKKLWSRVIFAISYIHLLWRLRLA